MAVLLLSVRSFFGTELPSLRREAWPFRRRAVTRRTDSAASGKRLSTAHPRPSRQRGCEHRAYVGVALIAPRKDPQLRVEL